MQMNLRWMIIGYTAGLINEVVGVKIVDCENCEYCKEIKAQDGWCFYGCKHAPYRGRWIAEIEECPKTGEHHD